MPYISRLGYIILQDEVFLLLKLKKTNNLLYIGAFHFRITAAIGLASLLFNKPVNGYNSIIEKKLPFLLPPYLLNYIA